MSVFGGSSAGAGEGLGEPTAATQSAVVRAAVERYLKVLRKLAGTDPDGLDGMHFVGDESAPDECPGCWARWALQDDSAEVEAQISLYAFPTHDCPCSRDPDSVLPGVPVMGEE